MSFVVQGEAARLRGALFSSIPSGSQIAPMLESAAVTMERHVGRLVEIRVPRKLTGDLLRAALARYEELVSRGNDRVIMCTDERPSKVHSPDAAEMLLHVSRSRDPRIERNAILVSAEATLQLQVRRTLESAGNPDRRMFHDASSLCDWLAPQLSRAEQERLRQFIDEGNIGA